MTDKLRECPFCGGELTCVSGTGVDLMTQDNRPYIGCKVCQWAISGEGFSKIAKLINHRPTEDRLREELEESKQAYDYLIHLMENRFPPNPDGRMLTRGR